MPGNGRKAVGDLNARAAMAAASDGTGHGGSRAAEF